MQDWSEKSFGARFTEQGKLALEHNSIQALIWGGNSVYDLESESN